MFLEEGEGVPSNGLTKIHIITDIRDVEKVCRGYDMVNCWHVVVVTRILRASSSCLAAKVSSHESSSDLCCIGRGVNTDEARRTRYVIYKGASSQAS